MDEIEPYAVRLYLNMRKLTSENLRLKKMLAWKKLLNAMLNGFLKKKEMYRKWHMNI